MQVILQLKQLSNWIDFINKQQNNKRFCFKYRLSEDNKPFEARVFIPRLDIDAKYTSSGVLLIIPASGGGEFHAIFGKLM